MTNVLILAAGDRSGGPADPPYPTWLLEVEGRLLIDRQVSALSIGQSTHFIFAFTQGEIDDNHVDDIARQLRPDASIVAIRKRTAGAACTALLAIGEIDLDQELIVVSATDHADIDYAEVVQSFRDRGADAGVLIFDSLHPRYSFVRLDEEGWVIEAAEKRPISRSANAGFYWYARGRDFFDSVKTMILKDAKVNGAFYISPSLNELILEGRKIAAHPIATSQYHPLKDLRQVDQLGHSVEERTRHAS